jgi:hypothetical protein
MPGSGKDSSRTFRGPAESGIRMESAVGRVGRIGAEGLAYESGKSVRGGKGLRVKIEKILQKSGSFDGQKALGMKLDAMQRPSSMSDAHDFAFRSPGADDEIGIMERLALDDQAVVASRFKRIRQTAKDASFVVMDRRCLAVHDAAIANDLAPEHMANALVSKTNSERRHQGREAFEDFVRDAGFFRSAWAGRNDQMAWLQSRDVVRLDLVIAHDAHIQSCVDLAKPLHEVVGKGVVVIDQQNHLLHFGFEIWDFGFKHASDC